MAYAFCPACRTSFRYRVNAPPGPAWLKDVARNAGRGEQAAVFCYGCWVPLRVGNVVTVVHPPRSNPQVKVGAKGMVVDITTQDNGVTVYDVDGIEEIEGLVWRQALIRCQVKLAELPAETTRLTLPSSGLPSAAAHVKR